MIDLTFVLESLKRRWIAIVIVTVLAAGCGVVSSASSSDSSAPVAPTYTAEATIYVDAYESSDANEYNYVVSDGYFIADARRIVVSDSVAGEVRRTLGEDVSIASPYWKDRTTKSNISTHFIFVEATADSEERALDAANMAADLAMENIKEHMSAKRVELYEGAVVKTVSDEAGDFGVDSLEPTIVTTLASSFSVKKVLVFALVGFVLACMAAVVFDYLRRRVRTAHDVERLLGVPLLGAVTGKGDRSAAFARVALAVDSLCRKNDVKTVAVCGLSDGDAAEEVFSALKSAVGFANVNDWAVLSSGSGNMTAVAVADCVVLSTAKSAASASQIEECARVLSMMDTPVLGAVFVESAKRG